MHRARVPPQARIRLLDEAASGTDAASAARLIREVQRASTVVLVAHDVSGLEGMFPVRVDL